MKSGTKQRLFWCAAALLILAALFLLSLRNAGQPLASGSAAGEPDINTENEIALFLQKKGLNIWRLMCVCLSVFLGFSLYHLFSDRNMKIPLAIGTGIALSAALELCQYFFFHTGSWRNALINDAGSAAGVGLAVLLSFFLRRMKERFERENSKNRTRVETILDALAIAAVMHYAVFRFLQSTMFYFFYTDRYKTVTLLLLILIGGIRFLYLLLKKVWRISEPKDQSFLLLRHALAFCLAIPFFLSGWLHNFKTLFFLPFAALCFYDMKPEKVFRVFLVTIGTVFAATVLCSLSGTVRNLVSIKEGHVASYGIINSTDFASYFSFLLVTAWCCMKNRNWQASVLFALFTGAVSYVVSVVSSSRTVLSVGLLNVFFILWDCLEENARGNAQILHGIGKGINWLAVFAFPLIGAFVAISTAAYGQKAPWGLALNEMLTDRLKVTWKPYLLYGIQPFGSTIEVMLGRGRTVISRLVSGYSYLDIGYAMLAIRCGWVITAVVAGLWMWFTARAIKAGKRRIAFAMAVLAAHALSEARILDVNYNIFLVMPFCALTSREEKADEGILLPRESGLRWFPALACVIMMGGVYFALPTALSWLRSFFDLKGWNSGTAAFGSFAVCVAIILLLALVWKAATMLWTRRSIKAAALLACAVLLLTAGALAINGTIDRGIEEQASRLAEEEPIIHTVQEAASLPVYAAEASELYRRTTGGFANHIFSTEELVRAPQGSMFADSSVEAITITESGGQYVQISDWSGLYSYDPAVIEALNNAGFTWQNFYTGKKICSLREAALFSGLKEEDAPVLRGPVRFATQNMMLDHVGGVYVVSFTVSSPQPAEDGKVATLEVLADAGERLLLQKQLTAEDFDGQDKCTYSMIYKIADAPLVFSAVSVEEGACLTVEEISTQRIGQRVELHDGVNRLVSPSDNWSAWILPPNSHAKDYQIMELVLRDSRPGDIYTCLAEIEFRNVTAVEGETFVFNTQGAVDGSRKKDNIWDTKLIQLKAPPEDGLYQYTAASMITESNANASSFSLDFHCENWATGSFKIKSITIEKARFITLQPSDEEVNAGEYATFEVAADGATAYQWYYQKSGETAWNKVINNGTSAVYTLKTEARHNGYIYRCKITGSNGSVYSEIAALTVK